MKKIIKLIITPLLFNIVISSIGHAQPIRYMDKAGNIFFVDKLGQVPEEYRDQVLTPTPKPILSKEQVKEVNKQVKEEEKQKKQQIADAEKERKKKIQELEMLRKREMNQNKKIDDSKALDRLGGK